MLNVLKVGPLNSGQRYAQGKVLIHRSVIYHGVRGQHDYYDEQTATCPETKTVKKQGFK